MTPHPQCSIICHRRAGKTNLGLYSVSVPDAMLGYPSSGYDDDLAWGAAWLHRATGDPAYLSDAFAFFTAAQQNASMTAPTPLAWNWDNQMPGVAFMLANATQWQNQTVIPKVGSATFFHCREGRGRGLGNFSV